MTRRNLLAGLLLTAAGWIASPNLALAIPPLPGAPQTKPIAIVGGKVFPVSAEPIENGVVIFAEGKIVAVGKRDEWPAEKRPANCEEIDATGKHVYPGLIDADSRLGLVEIDAVRATVDVGEVGEWNPNVRAERAVNPDSELIPVARANGIMATLTAPERGVITGASALIQLDGWTAESLVVKAPVGMHVQWPAMRFVRQSGDDGDGDAQKNFKENRDRVLRELTEWIAEARAYRDRPASEGRHDVKLAALAPVLDGSVPLFVSAEDAEQIESAVAFADREKLKLVIVGAYDAEECAPLLASRKIPVVVGGVHRLPRRTDDPFDHPFTLPARLHKAGVAFCIAHRGEPAHMRNLPYHAATAAAYGLSATEALRSITLSPAEIAGAADRLGSLEPKKDATLIVTSGDVLDIRSNVERAYIQGRAIDLSSRHTELRDRYEEKYRRLNQAK